MKQFTRRSFLRLTGTAGVIGLAGCSQIPETGGGIKDTDGDGTIDSVDYAPRDPQIQREEQIRKINPENPAAPDTPTVTATTVDLNTATVEELTTLPHVGVTLAERIVEFREGSDGPITDPLQLTQLSGLTEERIRDWDGLVEPPIPATA